MANNVADGDAVTDAIGGVAIAERPVSSRQKLLPELRLSRDVPARSLRAHLSRLPEAAPARVERPLIETDTAPGFSALRRITVGRGPIAGIGVDSRDGRIHVTNQADDSVAVLDATSSAVVAVVEGVTEPSAVAIADGRTVVATVTMSHDAVTVVDAGAEAPVVEHPLALSVRDVAVESTGRYVYAARSGRDGADLAIVDTSTGRVATMDLGTRAGAAAVAATVSPDGTRVYVATVDDLGGELVAVDTATRRVVGGLAFPAPLRDVVVSPDGATVYVGTCDLSFGGVIDVVDVRRMRVVDTVDVGGLITQLVAATDGDRLYVVGTERVSVVSLATREIVDTITVVDQPSCVAESSDGKQLFIADYAGAVTVLTAASSTESLLAKMMASDIIDVPMLELERADA